MTLINKEKIKEMVKAKMGRLLQSPDDDLKINSKDLLDSSSIYCRYNDERITESTLQEVIFQAGQECKIYIDDLVSNAIETIKSSNYEPDPPNLMKIQCPVCEEHSRVMGQYEVGSVLFGISFGSGGYEPVDQDIYDHYSDVRSVEYYCSNCEAEFDDLEVLNMVDEYQMKYNRGVETDIDIFEYFWDSKQQRSGFRK